MSLELERRVNDYYDRNLQAHIKATLEKRKLQKLEMKMPRSHSFI
jgi:hypothetical protein